MMLNTHPVRFSVFALFSDQEDTSLARVHILVPSSDLYVIFRPVPYAKREKLSNGRDGMQVAVRLIPNNIMYTIGHPTPVATFS